MAFTKTSFLVTVLITLLCNQQGYASSYIPSFLKNTITNVQEGFKSGKEKLKDKLKNAQDKLFSVFKKESKVKSIIIPESNTINNPTIELQKNQIIAVEQNDDDINNKPSENKDITKIIKDILWAKANKPKLISVKPKENVAQKLIHEEQEKFIKNPEPTMSSEQNIFSIEKKSPESSSASIPSFSSEKNSEQTETAGNTNEVNERNFEDENQESAIVGEELSKDFVSNSLNNQETFKEIFEQIMEQNPGLSLEEATNQTYQALKTLYPDINFLPRKQISKIYQQQGNFLIKSEKYSKPNKSDEQVQTSDASNSEKKEQIIDIVKSANETEQKGEAVIQETTKKREEEHIDKLKQHYSIPVIRNPEVLKLVKRVDQLPEETKKEFTKELLDLRDKKEKISKQELKIRAKEIISSYLKQNPAEESNQDTLEENLNEVE